MIAARVYGLVRQVGFALLLAATAGYAQQPATAHPDRDAPGVYLSFFFFHEDFAKWTEARVIADPAREAQIIRSSAKYLGIAPEEFSALEAITSQVADQLRAVGSEAHLYVQATANTKNGVDRNILASYESRRIAIIQSGISQMKNTLSANSWQGLYGYINNRHRLHLEIPRPAREPPH